MNDPNPLHLPVLLGDHPGDSILSILKPSSGEIVLDATVGLGGHSEAFLKAVGERGRLFAIDADGDNLALAKRRLGKWERQCTFIHDNFRNISRMELPMFDVIFADLGMSSQHVDDPGRGFSFRADGPLDLRFDRTRGTNASTLLRAATEDELKIIFRRYGELSQAHRLASAIFREARHQSATLETTTGLRGLVEATFGYRAPSLLPQIFQALRIAVNDEMGALEEFLQSVRPLLAPGGRLGIISFHSLEDRCVKETFRTWTTPEKDPRTGAVSKEASFELLTRKPIGASPEEVASNPRARSAKFRAVRCREITA